MQSFPAGLVSLAPRGVVTGAPAGDALENISTFELATGAVCYVESTRSYYWLDKSSVLTADGVQIVAPSAGPGRWLLLTDRTQVTFCHVNPGVAPNDPTEIVVGATKGYLMELGDYVYSETPLNPRVDRSLPIYISIGWASAAAEAGTVSWELAVTLTKVGKDLTVIDITTQAPTVPVPTPVIYQHAVFTLDPAVWGVDTAVDELHLRITRVTTGADPVFAQGIHHIACIQFTL